MDLGDLAVDAGRKVGVGPGRERTVEDRERPPVLTEGGQGAPEVIRDAGVVGLRRERFLEP